MTALSEREARLVERFAAETPWLVDEDPLPVEVLERLRKILDADVADCAHYDEVERRFLGGAWAPTDFWGVEYDGGVSDTLSDAEAWELLDSNPVRRHRRQTGVRRAVTLSDCASRRELAVNPWYAERPPGMRYYVNARITAPAWDARKVALWRGGSDFDERDRAVLDAVRLHLGRLVELTATRRRARVAVEALERLGETEDRLLVLLAPGGAVDEASPQARDTLARLLGWQEGPLPEPLRTWVATGGTTPFRLERLGRRIDAHLAGELLVIELSAVDPAARTLTRREREVLELAAGGLTNLEIANALVVAEGTVRKHLEHAYRKLGVPNRAAAAAKLHQRPTEPPPAGK